MFRIKVVTFDYKFAKITYSIQNIAFYSNCCCYMHTLWYTKHRLERSKKEKRSGKHWIQRNRFNANNFPWAKYCPPKLINIRSFFFIILLLFCYCCRRCYRSTNNPNKRISFIMPFAIDTLKETCKRKTEQRKKIVHEKRRFVFVCEHICVTLCDRILTAKLCINFTFKVNEWINGWTRMSKKGRHFTYFIATNRIYFRFRHSKFRFTSRGNVSCHVVPSVFFSLPPSLSLSLSLFSS